MNEELRKQAAACTTLEALRELAAASGHTLTDEEIARWQALHTTGELTDAAEPTPAPVALDDDAIDGVAGGHMVQVFRDKP